MTQNERLLEYMQTHDVITSLEAQKSLGIMRLAARISDLRGQGHEVEMIPIRSKNRYGEPTRYAGYRLKK